jgi:hypothetical protein
MEVCGVQLVESDNTMPTITAAAEPGPVIESPPLAVAEMELVCISKEDAAKGSAARGLSVFLIRPYIHPGADTTPEQMEAAAKDAKAPLLKNWQNIATQDARQIHDWWTQYPDANIAATTDNLIVVDVDRRNGGIPTFELLELTESFPRTAIANTQGGGHHHFYALPQGMRVKGGTHKLGAGVDIKSRGGYVLLSGSTIEGRAYAWANENPIAPAPQWLIDRCNISKPKTDAAGKRLLEEDDQAVELATQWMLNKAPTAEYGNIDDTTYKVAAMVLDFGVSVETATDIVFEWNELKCFPPGNLERLPAVVESASCNRENAIGCKHPMAPGLEAVEIDESRAPAIRASALSTSTLSTPSSRLATPLLQFDPVGLELRPWVIPGFACRGRVTLLAGPGGVAKSTYYLMVAIATVSGRSDICGFPILKRERVWVWNQEDDIAEMQRRVAAIMKAFDVSWDDLKDENGESMLFLDSGVDKPLMLANRSAEHSIMPGKQVADVIASAKANKIAVIILDPLVEFHEASENDNVQMRAVVGQVRRIAVEADCAAMLSTHTRKPPVASSDGFAGEMDAARGASAQLGVVRIGATIFSMSPKQAKEYRLADGATHLDYVRIDIAKNNLAPVLPEPLWFKREGVRVGGGFEQEGESVGVLRPVTLDKKAPTSTIHLPTILAKIIATNLSREKHFKVSEVLASATPAQQAMFGDKKNRARCIADAFEGSDVSSTGSGILTKTSAQGKETTLHLGRTSSFPQQPKTGGRGLENGEDTDT